MPLGSAVHRAGIRKGIAMPATIPISGLQMLADRFDGFIIEQFGVVEDGTALYPGALDALSHLNAKGLPVVIVATSGDSDEANIARLERLGVEPDLYDRLVSTAHLMRHALVAQSLSEDKP